MANPSLKKIVRKTVQPQITKSVAVTVSVPAPAPDSETSAKSTRKNRISLLDMRKGIVLAEILGEPLAKRRGNQRWR